MTDIKITRNTNGASNITAIRATIGLQWILLDAITLEVVGIGQGKTCGFPLERLQEAQDAATFYLGEDVAKTVAAQTEEAGKVTLEVRNVGKSQGDFKRANNFAREHEGVFSGSSKTWTIRVTADERTDLERNSLKVVGGGSSNSVQDLLNYYGSSDNAWEREDTEAWIKLSGAGY